MRICRITNLWITILCMIILIACPGCSSEGKREEGLGVVDGGTITSTQTADISPNPKDGMLSVGKPTNSPTKTWVMIGDYKYYDTLEELEKDAHYIIYGRVISQYCERRSLRIPNEDMPNPTDEADDLNMVTISEVLVIQSFTDSAKENDIIKVLQLGGRGDSAVILTPEEPEIEISEEYLFYLSEDVLIDHGGWLLCNRGALYHVNGEEITPVRGGFHITFDHLRNMKKK